ncbi:MAG: DcaP family trimeric outer membrane transporter [Nitratireductor sp.]|nr:DcaP family trimeric outer membrane transporter [Nitratireductor sp.]
MKKIVKISTWLAALAVAALPFAAFAAEDDMADLKKDIRALEEKIEKLESQPAVNVVAISMPEGMASEIQDRMALNDQQEAAARVGNLVLDPKYTGFIQIPNTEVIMKFNAKPHLDVTADSGNAGDKYRFVPAKIPVAGDPAEGGGEQFNVNANGSQLRWDVRAPNLPGSPRFYYQNDFFGQSGADMKYRLQHLYGSVYNIVAGFTYGVFENPDIWPDTVDYEGPNAVNFARRPLIHYKQKINDSWNATFGVEKPDIYVDTTGDDSASLDTPIPDIGANLRWESADRGHMQLSAIVRDIGVNSASNGSDNVVGWGFNLGGSYNLTTADTLLVLVNYGEGIGGLGNDASFVNSDAAFDENGDLVALPYWSGLLALTHKWNDKWRSTATYGYVNLDNEEAQAGDAYHTTTYASANLVWQLRKQLSVGLEGLYGMKETKDGSDGDVWRVQMGMVYSIF